MGRGLLLTAGAKSACWHISFSLVLPGCFGAGAEPRLCAAPAPEQGGRLDRDVGPQSPPCTCAAAAGVAELPSRWVSRVAVLLRAIGRSGLGAFKNPSCFQCNLLFRVPQITTGVCSCSWLVTKRQTRPKDQQVLWLS